MAPFGKVKGCWTLPIARQPNWRPHFGKPSEQGKYPVLCDQSPCLHRMRECIKKMKLYEPAEFIYTFLREKLIFTPINRPVAIHITCSMRKMGLADTIIALARLCSSKVIVPEEVGCCGFAETGDSPILS